MDKQRNLFYGFIVGFVLMILPIPRFFFWEDIMNIVEPLFQYSGFMILVICGIPLIFNIFQNFNQ